MVFARFMYKHVGMTVYYLYIIRGLVILLLNPHYTSYLIYIILCNSLFLLEHVKFSQIVKCKSIMTSNSLRHHWYPPRNKFQHTHWPYVCKTYNITDVFSIYIGVLDQVWYIRIFMFLSPDSSPDVIANLFCKLDHSQLLSRLLQIFALDKHQVYCYLILFTSYHFPPTQNICNYSHWSNTIISYAYWLFYI